MSHVSSWLGYSSSPRAAAPWQPREDAASSFKGNWLSHLDFTTPSDPEARKLWSVVSAQASPFKSVPVDQRRSTDCTFRKDMQLLAQGDVQGAAAAKQALEDEQRRKRALAVSA